MKYWKTLLMFLIVGVIATSCGGSGDEEKEESIVITNPSTYTGGVGNVGNVSNYSSFVTEVQAGRFISVPNGRMTFIYNLYSYEVRERDGIFGIDYTSTDVDFLRTFGRSVNGSTVNHEFGSSNQEIINNLVNILNNVKAQVQTGPAAFRVLTFNDEVYEINLAIPLVGNPVYYVSEDAEQMYQITNMF